MPAKKLMQTAGVILCCVVLMYGQSARRPLIPQETPQIWNEAEVDSWKLPLAKKEVSPSHLRAEYFNRIPIRPVVQMYPVYRPDKAPRGYWAKLQALEPKVNWDAESNRPALRTSADWIRAGELVYDVPVRTIPADRFPQIQQQEWFEKLNIPVASDGTIPGLSFVIRKKGQIEIGVMSCGTCHTRVLPPGQIVKGTQCNLPVARIEAEWIRAGLYGDDVGLRKYWY